MEKSKKVKIYILSLIIFITLTACQTVTDKIDQKTELEKKELSKWLNKTEENLKSFYGQPDKVEFLKTRNMAFKDLFKDNNDINEKSVVGFSSFIVMIIFALVDIITGIYGKEIVIQDYIYNSFVIITLGSFGIAEVGKIFGKKNNEDN